MSRLSPCWKFSYGVFWKEIIEKVAYITYVLMLKHLNTRKYIPALRVHPMRSNAHNCYRPTLWRWWNSEIDFLKNGLYSSGINSGEELGGRNSGMNFRDKIRGRTLRANYTQPSFATINSAQIKALKLFAWWNAKVYWNVTYPHTDGQTDVKVEIVI